jgi:hypothetical protein
MEQLWVENRLSWQAVAMMVALTLLVVAADLTWRLTRMPTSRLAAILLPAGLAWLGGVWWLVGRLVA